MKKILPPLIFAALSFFCASAQEASSTARLDSLHRAFSLTLQSKAWDSCRQALYAYADHADDLGLYQTGLDTLRRWTPFLEGQPGGGSFTQARLYLCRSFLEHRMQNNQGQLEALEKAIDIFEQLDTLHLNVAFAYKNAGQILVMRLNYPKAIAYFEKALANDTIGKYTASVYSYLADCHYWQGEYDLAIPYLDKGMAVKGSPKYTAMLSLSGAAIYAKKGDAGRAEQFARQALNIYNNHPGIGLEPAPIYASMASALHLQNKNREAGQYWDLALKASASLPEKNRERAKMLVNAGDFFAATAQPDKALPLYQEAITHAYPDFSSLDLKDNPSSDYRFVESWAMTAPARKARMMAARGELANASHCYDLALRQARLLKTTYGSDAAKIYMGGYSNIYYEEAIGVQAALYAQNGQRAHLERIYQLMEESKADVLREAVERNRVLLQGALPDSLLQLEQNLRLALAEARNEKQSESLLELERNYEKVVGALKKQDPRFLGMDQQPVQTPLSEAMKILAADNALLLNYFFGKDAVYVLGAHPDGAFLHTVADVVAFRSAVQRFGAYFRDANQIIDDPQGYFQAAHALYAMAVPAEAAARIEAARKLIIAPDGPLAYIPFEALLTEAYPGGSLGRAPYLLRKLPVQYAWSAELLWRVAPPRKGGRFVQFDPGFANGERGLAALVMGEEETAGLRGLRRFSGASASLDQFFTWSPQARILHLSTHARATAVGEPQIEFYDGPLTLPQLYALLLPADLAVLSACETNLGGIAVGEGVMSLARGFAYAGAASLVAAQWNINESATAIILGRFYRQLAKKQNKLAALREAKLHYLETAPSAAFQSPYYWAGLSFYGQDGPAPPPKSPWYLWAAGLASLLLGAFLFFRKKLSKSG
jgi:CHAT domain-containing protein/tetratricopeptide (TPR) repeat protein